MNKALRQRACGVVILDQQILMVRHVHDGRDYWTLPGGGIDPSETIKEAARREVLEETGLELNPMRFLFKHETERNMSHCVLMSKPLPGQPIKLGYDPEQVHLPEADRMLQDVGWHPINSMKMDYQVAQVIKIMGFNF